ncbi:cell division topological specificity factor MinE [Thiorhodospira sibirica]|uniref:cell division topological specificity factor MinE n=1 Tax=Thiorhodospira sibirica TaxID=154347 RepID=UPI00022C5E25|nr:cell division topological specificity factor MinE [Thiorhodospira sibirica]
MVNSLLSYFQSQNKTPSTAKLAKERLQVIVARERSQRNGPDYLPLMQEELLNVIRKYVPVDRDSVMIQLDRDGDYEILELNVILPEQDNSSSRFPPD